MDSIVGYGQGDQSIRNQEAAADDIGNSVVLFCIVLCRHGLTTDEGGRTGYFIAVW